MFCFPVHCLYNCTIQPSVTASISTSSMTSDFINIIMNDAETNWAETFINIRHFEKYAYLSSCHQLDVKITLSPEMVILVSISWH